MEGGTQQRHSRQRQRRAAAATSHNLPQHPPESGNCSILCRGQAQWPDVSTEYGDLLPHFWVLVVARPRRRCRRSIGSVQESERGRRAEERGSGPVSSVKQWAAFRLQAEG